MSSKALRLLLLVQNKAPMLLEQTEEDPAIRTRRATVFAGNAWQTSDYNKFSYHFIALVHANCEEVGKTCFPLQYNQPGLRLFQLVKLAMQPFA